MNAIIKCPDRRDVETAAEYVEESSFVKSQKQDVEPIGQLSCCIV